MSIYVLYLFIHSASGEETDAFAAPESSRGGGVFVENGCESPSKDTAALHTVHPNGGGNCKAEAGECLSKERE
jgi:hypothetical protein